MRRLAVLCVIALTVTACTVHSTASILVSPDKAINIDATTDRGLTPTTITIGALMYKPNTFAQFGVSTLGGKPPAPATWRASPATTASGTVRNTIALGRLWSARTRAGTPARAGVSST